MTALTATYSTAAALRRAEAEHRQRTQDWYGQCLRFVRSMVGVPALFNEAKDGWAGAKVRHTNGNAPAGSAIFYAGGQHGHVVLSAGNGMCWSTDLIRRGQVDLVPVSSAEVKWGYRLLGWTEDLNGYKLRFDPPPRLSVSEVQWAATHANLIPGSESRVALIKGSLVALGCGKRTDTFRDLWQRWQQKCGYRGTDADGIPGTASCAALASRCGYVVTP